MTEEEFYQQCAIAAMQGLQESSTKISLLADIAPEKTAVISFNIADAMLKEYRKRKNHQKTDNQLQS